MERFGKNLVDILERGWEVLEKMREQETSCRLFDNTPGTQKHRATELFNERHGLSALFCAGFRARCQLLDTKSAFNKLFGGLTHPLRQPLCRKCQIL